LKMDPDSRDIKQRLRDAKLELKKSKRKDYYKILGECPGLRDQNSDAREHVKCLLEHLRFGFLAWKHVCDAHVLMLYRVHRSWTYAYLTCGFPRTRARHGFCM